MYCTLTIWNFYSKYISITVWYSKTSLKKQIFDFFLISGGGGVLYTIQYLPYKKDYDRSEGKCRRCCLRDVLECRIIQVAARMFWTKVFWTTSILVGWWFGMVRNGRSSIFSKHPFHQVAFALYSIHPFLQIILGVNL